MTAAIEREDQKIAACGSSYRDMHSNVGAAAGCDLFAPETKPNQFFQTTL
jgi:hypothetical protein